MKFLEINAKNMFISLLYIANYIRSRKVKLGSIHDVSQLKGFREAVWNFIFFIYKSSWDTIDIDFFRNEVANKFTSKVLKTKTSSTSGLSKDKVAETIKLPPPIPAHSSKEVFERSKFFGKGKKPMTINKLPQKLSYTQAAGPSVTGILKLKENYPNLPVKEIENIQKIINDSGKSKPYIKITTRDSSHKQIVVPMGKENANKFMASSSSHIANINGALKNIKLDIMADYVWLEPISITIVTNKVALLSNLQVIENFVKNVKNINSKDIKTPRLP